MCTLLNYASKGIDANDMDRMTFIQYNVSKLKMAFPEGSLFAKVDANGQPRQFLIEYMKKVAFVQYQPQFFSLKYTRMSI